MNLIDLDRALDASAVADARKAKVVELRFFGGLSVEETVDVLDVSNDTIKRDWPAGEAVAAARDGRRGAMSDAPSPKPPAPTPSPDSEPLSPQALAPSP